MDPNVYRTKSSDEDESPELESGSPLIVDDNVQDEPLNEEEVQVMEDIHALHMVTPTDRETGPITIRRVQELRSEMRGSPPPPSPKRKPSKRVSRELFGPQTPCASPDRMPPLNPDISMGDKMMAKTLRESLLGNVSSETPGCSRDSEMVIQEPEQDKQGEFLYWESENNNNNFRPISPDASLHQELLQRDTPVDLSLRRSKESGISVSDEDLQQLENETSPSSHSKSFIQQAAFKSYVSEIVSNVLPVALGPNIATSPNRRLERSPLKRGNTGTEHGSGSSKKSLERSSPKSGNTWAEHGSGSSKKSFERSSPKSGSTWTEHGSGSSKSLERSSPKSGSTWAEHGSGSSKILERSSPKSTNTLAEHGASSSKRSLSPPKSGNTGLVATSSKRSLERPKGGNTRPVATSSKAKRSLDVSPSGISTDGKRLRRIPSLPEGRETVASPPRRRLSHEPEGSESTERRQPRKRSYSSSRDEKTGEKHQKKE